MSPTVPVIVETWQFECCGDPFTVGDKVAWQLSFNTDSESIAEARTTLSVTVHDAPDRDEPCLLVDLVINASEES